MWQTCDLIGYRYHPFSLSSSTTISLPSSTTISDPFAMAPKAFKLEDYKPILITHEQEFRATKGADRMEVIANIMQEIIALRQEDLDESTTNGLGKVSAWH